MTTLTHYEVLGVPRGASSETIRAAYRVKARSHHPDAGGSAAGMRAVNLAWQVLRDPSRRAHYDRELAAAEDVAHGVGSTGPAAERASRPGDPEPEVRSAAEWAELLDVRPFGPTQALEGWWALAPPAALVVAIGLLVGGVFFASPALLVFSVLWFFIALGLFVLAPLRAMSRPGPRSRRP